MTHSAFPGPLGPVFSTHVSSLLPGSLEGRSGGAFSRAPARSNALDRAELGFFVDPEPGSQELADSPLELWGPDGVCRSLALRDEVDSIFPDFFAC